jgi:hypothetical protein
VTPRSPVRRHGWLGRSPRAILARSCEGKRKSNGGERESSGREGESTTAEVNRAGEGESTTPEAELCRRYQQGRAKHLRLLRLPFRFPLPPPRLQLFSIAHCPFCRSARPSPAAQSGSAAPPSVCMCGVPLFSSLSCLPFCSSHLYTVYCSVCCLFVDFISCCVDHLTA